MSKWDEYLGMAKNALSEAERIAPESIIFKDQDVTRQLALDQAKQREHVLVVLIFSAFSAEAMINHYAYVKAPSKRTHKSLDRVKLVDKWLAYPEVFRGHTVDPGAEPIQGLQRLVTIRNDLAHPKTEAGSPFDETKWVTYTLIDARDAVSTVVSLAAMLERIDKDWTLGSIRQDQLPGGATP